MSNSRGATLRLTTAAAAVTLLAAACTSSASAVDTTPRAAPHASPAATTPAATTTVGKQIVIANQGFPAAFGFTPDGAQIVYGLRLNGQIRFHVLASGADTLFYKVPNLVHSGEQGLLGVAVDPGFPAKAFVYAYPVRSINGTLRNQILRIQDSNGTGTNATVIFSSNTVAGEYHDGGHIAFGPDGMLYAVVGESHDPSNAQSLKTPAGKVLRMTPTGGVPADNPFPNKRIFSYGLRNSFGFAFDPQTELLWETENGPECNDELNLIGAGENHGWGPNESCSGTRPQDTNQDGPNPVLPLRWYTPTIAPTGTAFCHNCGLPNSEGTMFFGTFNTSEIRRVTLNAARTGIATVKTVYKNSDGVLSIQAAPDGRLYFSDPNAIYRLIAN